MLRDVHRIHFLLETMFYSISLSIEDFVMIRALPFTT